VDDVAALSAKTGTKALGVVVDDAAVTPQYVKGLSPKRELPIIWRIAKGSIVNKLVIILPIALLLSWIAPWALTPILMVGGTYLCYEGAEKIWELVTGSPHEEKHAAVQQGADAEDTIVKGAVRTDLILSAEIMVISMNSIADETILMRAAVLIAVGLAITALVYGAVGLLVKMDDAGLALMERDAEGAQKFGDLLVRSMPKVMTVISYVGMFAMLWVGGHILLEGTSELGATYPYAWVHHLSETADGVPGVGGALAWALETVCSMILGVITGAVVLALLHLLPKVWQRKDSAAQA
jgi:predicted DNA repair protein MutK